VLSNMSYVEYTWPWLLHVEKDETGLTNLMWKVGAIFL